MRFEVSYPADVWSVMPNPAADADELWVAEQRTAYAGSSLAPYDEVIEGAAREALRRRRSARGTSLFFRPVELPMTGVMHVLPEAAPPDVEADPLTWMLPGVELLLEPTISDLETARPHGYRIAYVAAETDRDGEHLAGIAYGLLVDGLLGIVFSELARTDVAGAMQLYARIRWSGSSGSSSERRLGRRVGRIGIRDRPPGAHGGTRSSCPRRDTRLPAPRRGARLRRGRGDPGHPHPPHRRAPRRGPRAPRRDSSAPGDAPSHCSRRSSRQRARSPPSSAAPRSTSRPRSRGSWSPSPWPSSGMAGSLLPLRADVPPTSGAVAVAWVPVVLGVATLVGAWNVVGGEPGAAAWFAAGAVALVVQAGLAIGAVAARRRMSGADRSRQDERLGSFGSELEEQRGIRRHRPCRPIGCTTCSRRSRPPTRARADGELSPPHTGSSNAGA